MHEAPSKFDCRAAGALIRKLRLARLLTRQVLAAQAGLSVATVQFIEGGVANPKPSTVAKLYTALNSVAPVSDEDRVVLGVPEFKAKAGAA